MIHSDLNYLVAFNKVLQRKDTRAHTHIEAERGHYYINKSLARIVIPWSKHNHAEVLL